MKYIRTKDGKIYKVEKEYKNEIVVISSKTGNSNLSFHKSFVSAQADTIEELCDEFVCDHNNGTRVIQIKECKPQFPLCKDTIDYFRRNNQTFYGAIWTDKGLIYVAKMNDKGELELL